MVLSGLGHCLADRPLTRVHKSHTSFRYIILSKDVNKKKKRGREAGTHLCWLIILPMLGCVTADSFFVPQHRTAFAAFLRSQVWDPCPLVPEHHHSTRLDREHLLNDTLGLLVLRILFFFFLKCMLQIYRCLASAQASHFAKPHVMIKFNRRVYQSLCPLKKEPYTP